MSHADIAVANFWIGSALGFALGSVVTTILAIKYREWEEARDKKKWYVRRGVWTR